MPVSGFPLSDQIEDKLRRNNAGDNGRYFTEINIRKTIYSVIIKNTYSELIYSTPCSILARFPLDMPRDKLRMIANASAGRPR